MNEDWNEWWLINDLNMRYKVNYGRKLFFICMLLYSYIRFYLQFFEKFVFNFDYTVILKLIKNYMHYKIKLKYNFIKFLNQQAQWLPSSPPISQYYHWQDFSNISNFKEPYSKGPLIG